MEKEYIAWWIYDQEEQRLMLPDMGIRIVKHNTSFMAAWLAANLNTDLWKLGLRGKTHDKNK